MIKLHNVTKKYDTPVAALDNLNLHIPRGSFIFITGHSGAGKTTLLKIMFSSERPTSGEVLVDNVNIGRLTEHKIPLFRRRLGIVYQDFKLIPSRPVYDNVAFPLEIRGENPRRIKKRVWQVLKWVGLLAKKDAMPLSLSGGEQQRVAIARAVIANPVLLLADEPTGNLDAELARDILKLFKAINARGTTVLIATHNDEMARQFSDSIVHLTRGRLDG